MDGVGRALDNVFIEKFGKTIKYEEFHLHEYQSLSEMREGNKKIHAVLQQSNDSTSHCTTQLQMKNTIPEPLSVFQERVIVPESSWLLRPRAMDTLSFEECVKIYKSRISWKEHLKVA